MPPTQVLQCESEKYHASSSTCTADAWPGPPPEEAHLGAYDTAKAADDTDLPGDAAVGSAAHFARGAASDAVDDATLVDAADACKMVSKASIDFSDDEDDENSPIARSSQIARAASVAADVAPDDGHGDAQLDSGAVSTEPASAVACLGSEVATSASDVAPRVCEVAMLVDASVAQAGETVLEFDGHAVSGTEGILDVDGDGVEATLPSTRLSEFYGEEDFMRQSSASDVAAAKEVSEAKTKGEDEEDEAAAVTEAPPSSAPRTTSKPPSDFYGMEDFQRQSDASLASVKAASADTVKREIASEITSRVANEAVGEPVDQATAAAVSVAEAANKSSRGHS